MPMPKGELLVKGDFGTGGEVVGPVHIVDYTDPASYGSIHAGEIMVAERTVPDNEAAMKQAAAIVTSASGKMSHTMLTAKMNGWTAVVGATDVMNLLHNGQMVVVDGPGAAVYQYGEGGAAAPPAGGQSLADRMAAMAAAQGKTLSPEFLERLKNRQS